MNEVLIRKVTTLPELWLVYKLVNEVYAKSGIANKSGSGMMIHHPDQDVVPESHVFMAEIDGRYVGTITYTIDNQFGLMVDDDFKDEIAFYRLMYSKISSVWRFAILPEFQSNLQIMKRLIGAAFYHMKEYNVPICFLTISPEHARIYTRIMGMVEVARGYDSNPLIKKEHADIILLKAFADKIPEKWYSEEKQELVEEAVA
jgi:hypothetical protein